MHLVSSEHYNLLLLLFTNSGYLLCCVMHAGFYSSEVLPKYPVKKTNRGIALIINNEKFEGNSRRLGADVDFST